MVIIIHLIFAVLAIVIGTVQLLRTKGTQSHKLVGRFWMFAMLVAALSSFFIKGGFDEPYWGFNGIHLLSLWVMFCVPFSLYSAIKHNVNRHKRYAIGAYVGTFIAGVVAILTPDRLLYQWLFT